MLPHTENLKKILGFFILRATLISFSVRVFFIFKNAPFNFFSRRCFKEVGKREKLGKFEILRDFFEIFGRKSEVRKMKEKIRKSYVKENGNN